MLLSNTAFYDARRKFVSFENDEYPIYHLQIVNYFLSRNTISIVLILSVLNEIKNYFIHKEACKLCDEYDDKCYK